MNQGHSALAALVLDDGLDDLRRLRVVVCHFVLATLGFASSVVYALVFGAARTLLSKGRVMRNVLRGSGGIPVFFGVDLMVERPSH